MNADVSWLNRPLQTWFQDAKFRPYPLQPQLDCQGCTRSMLAESSQEKNRWKQWKCCAFQPFVPNYLLGAMLETRSLPSNERSQFILTPLGLLPSIDYRLRFEASEDEKRGESLICAFYDLENRSCSNWKNRPSECATYFCQPNSFFQERSKDLFDWENAVAQMTLVEHGFSPKQIEDLTDMLNGESEAGDCWGELAGNEEKFYRSCWAWARDRKGAEILSWLGPERQARFDSWMSFA